MGFGAGQKVPGSLRASVENFYILITAARNEGLYIRETLESVVRQTCRPILWVVCCNDSNDDTESIVAEYRRSFPFIAVINLSFGGTRSWANQSRAVSEAVTQADGMSYGFIGLLDADVVLEPDYYERLIAKFEDPLLGVAAGEQIECFPDGSQRRLHVPSFTTMGPTQFFRRKCFEDIGGHRPLVWGGQDTLAEIMARMKGWKTSSFRDIAYRHRRATGTAGRGAFSASFECGVRGQKLGMHPAYALAKSISRMAQKPYVLGALSWAAGFWYGYRLPDDPQVSADCRKYLRSEELRTLSSIWKRRCK